MQTPILKARIPSVDILRGMVMIIMALDHVRDYFHISAMTADPTNPATTTPALFFTRWITHFCAPVFVFLAGTSAFLMGQKKTKKELSLFLLKRGLWLMLLEVMAFNLVFSFDPLYHFVGFQVIWVTGLSMVLLSALIYLPLHLLFLIGIIIVAGHHFLDAFNYPSMNEIPYWWGFLHQQYFTNYAPGRFLGIVYPLVPWPGVILLGYCMGAWFVKSVDAARREKYLSQAGLAIIALFLLLRWTNIYGDPSLWTKQSTTIRTILSFFNTSKYPPSLLYLCMTIGPALLALAWLENAKARWTSFVMIYGRVPLFYYFVHFFVIHTLCMIVFFVSGRPMSDAITGMMVFRPNDFGYSLGVVYLVWIAIVAGLYPLMRWYNRYKTTHDNWWLRYL